MVIGLVDERGSRVFTAGKLDHGTGQEEADGDTAFEIASITKTFTALLRDFKLATIASSHRNKTEWRPCDVVRQFGSHGSVAIGELNVGRDDLTGRLSEELRNETNETASNLPFNHGIIGPCPHGLDSLRWRARQKASGQSHRHLGIQNS
jgi:hypothetical protein